VDALREERYLQDSGDDQDPQLLIFLNMIFLDEARAVEADAVCSRKRETRGRRANNSTRRNSQGTPTWTSMN